MTWHPDDAATNNSTSFKYKSSFIGESTGHNNNRVEKCKNSCSTKIFV